MIRLKNEKDMAALRESGAILAHTLHMLADEVCAGAPLRFFDTKTRELLKNAGATPAFLGYRPDGAGTPYPAALCTSVNACIVHGIPTSDVLLRDGDIVTLDLGVSYRGYVTDAAVTVAVGPISATARALLDATKRALSAGVAACKSGGRLGDIGASISEVIAGTTFSIAQGLTGHGVGFALHEDPTIYNYGSRGEGIELRPGLVLAIEPMVCVGSGDTKQLSDGSFVTRDGSLAAHFEHSVAITERGVEILTDF